MQARTFTVRSIHPALVIPVLILVLPEAYKFLDPVAYGGEVAGYVFGVLVGECIVFSIVWGVSKLRNKIFAKRRPTILDDAYPKEKIQTGQV